MPVTVPPIDVPQIQPSPNAPQAVNPEPFLRTWLSHPTSFEAGGAQIGEGLKSLVAYQQYQQNKKLEALKAVSELYGAGGPGAVQQYGPTINNATGTNVVDTSQQGAQGQAPSMGSGGPGGGGGLPASQTPQQPAQTMPQTQPSQGIMASLQAGHPDFTGHLAKIQKLQTQMGGYANMGKYGETQTQQTAAQIAAEKAAMDAEMAPLSYEAKQQELKNAQQSIPMEISKGVAAETSKQGDVTPLINDAETTFKRLDSRLQQYHQSGASLGSSNVSKLSGGRIGSDVGDAAMGDAKHLMLTINKLLVGRFQMSGDQLLTSAMAPSPNYSPRKNAQLMSDLYDTLQSVKAGKIENVQRVKRTLEGDLNAQ